MAKAEIEIKVEITGEEEAYNTLDRLNSKLETLKQNLKDINELCAEIFV
ncbi:MAG: hypothetical protein KAS32_13890 [Candidatus Peribacteraceae bacterium]|nr:hypothetical protein [Candidatus Peribacteraceae bacterium]